MRDIAIVIQNKNENVTPIDTINAINHNGFKKVFIQWYNENWLYAQEQQLELARKLKLNIIFAHLGYKKINSIWIAGEEGEEVVEEYKKDLDVCKRNNINLAIMHLTTGKNPPAYNEIGLNRIKTISEYAKKLNIRIAFENTRIQGYLEYVLGNIKDEHIGICFDIGHYHTHFKDQFNFNLFKNRIFAVHLHDNHGDGIDEHLLPFDGNINWESTIQKLVECNYNGPITLESCYKNTYLEMSIDEFYKKAYERAIRISQIFDKYDKQVKN